MTLTKAILIDTLFSKIGLSRREAKDIVEAFFGEISESLSKGQHVKIAGFGRFEVRDKKQRPGRNPRTGEVIPIKARRVVIFHASTQVREKLADINHDLRG